MASFIFLPISRVLGRCYDRDHVRGADLMISNYYVLPCLALTAPEEGQHRFSFHTNIPTHCSCVMFPLAPGKNRKRANSLQILNYAKVQLTMGAWAKASASLNVKLH